jgi:hypothetical protein
MAQAPPPWPEPGVLSRGCDARGVTTIAVDHSFALRISGNVKGYKMPLQSVVDFLATALCERFEPLVPVGANPSPLRSHPGHLTAELPISVAAMERLESLARHLDRAPSVLLLDSWVTHRSLFDKVKFPVDNAFIATKAAVSAAKARAAA